MNATTRKQKLDRRPRIVIDRSYFRTQAIDAMRTFAAPLYGVYAAATGTKPTVADESREAKKRA